MVSSWACRALTLPNAHPQGHAARRGHLPRTACVQARQVAREATRPQNTRTRRRVRVRKAASGLYRTHSGCVTLTCACTHQHLPRPSARRGVALLQHVAPPRALRLRPRARPQRPARLPRGRDDRRGHHVRLPPPSPPAAGPQGPVSTCALTARDRCPVPFQCTITPRALRAEEAVAEYFDQRA